MGHLLFPLCGNLIEDGDRLLHVDIARGHCSSSGGGGRGGGHRSGGLVTSPNPIGARRATGGAGAAAVMAHPLVNVVHHVDRLVGDALEDVQFA